MNWVNLKVSTLRHPDYVGCEPVQRATWLNVLTFCTEQENGGRIEGARGWKDRQWQQTCGVMLSEVNTCAPLLTWDGEALVVWQYPLDKEQEVIERREVAKTNGKLGGRPKNQHQNPHGTNGKPTSVSGNNQRRGQRPKAEGERKENEKENPPNPHAEPPAPEKDVKPKTPEALAVAALFNRRPETDWDAKEIKAFKSLVKRGVMNLDAMDAMAEYYASERAKGGEGRHRRDLKTFLNNFDGELDRAESFAAGGNGHVERQPAAYGQPMNKPPEPPPGFR